MVWREQIILHPIYTKKLIYYLADKVDILYYKTQIVNVMAVRLVIPQNRTQGSVPQHIAPNCMVYVVAARSKVRVCGHSLAGIVGSDPAGDMNVCLL